MATGTSINLKVTALIKTNT